MVGQPTDAPVPMLRGRLVYLRPAERDDIPLFVRWLADERTSRHLAIRSPISVAMEERWFDDLLEHHGRDRWHFVICLLADGRPVGSLDLHEIDLTNGGAGLGVQVGDPADRGRGFGGDAIRVLVDFGFERLRLERVWLDVFDANPDARRLYERLGFVHEATFRNGVFRGGQFEDVHRLAIVRAEWEERRKTEVKGDAAGAAGD